MNEERDIEKHENLIFGMNTDGQMDFPSMGTYLRWESACANSELRLVEQAVFKRPAPLLR